MKRSSATAFWMMTVVLTVMAAAGGFLIARVSVDSALAGEVLAQVPCAPGDPGCPFQELQRVGAGFEGQTDGLAGEPRSLQETAFNFVRVFLALFGLYFLAMMVYAGFLYATAGGEDEKVKTAKSTIRNAIIGILIISTSYAFLTLLFNTIQR